MTDYPTSWWEYVRDAAGGIVYSEWQNDIKSPMMRNLETKEVASSPDLPVGALYVMHDPENWYGKGSDGLTIGCRCLGGHTWIIDGRASNCTMMNDKEHRCWVRHGTVGERLTVDKNGKTCGAGAGSFFMGRNNEWHGFLIDGVLVQR